MPKTKKPKKLIQTINKNDFFISALILLLLMVCGYTLAWQIITTKDNSEAYRLYGKYSSLKQKSTQLIELQNGSEVHVVEEKSIYHQLDAIRHQLDEHDYAKAQVGINDFFLKLAGYFGQIHSQDNTSLRNKAEAEAIKLSRTKTHPINSVELPILLYHKTPSDFEQVLEHISSHGYHTTSMLDLARHLNNGSPLPEKPIIITFDDGFSDQLKAFDLLKKHNMRATFYIIPGGERSNWCIGVDKKNINCGDSYLSQAEIKRLDRSGLIEIGAHTMDHLALPNYPADLQSFEILESKRILENILNHPISSFAYPYGRFDSQTVNLVDQAGFSTGVTTQAGTLQTLEGILTLKRIRNGLLLP